MSSQKKLNPQAIENFQQLYTNHIQMELQHLMRVTKIALDERKEVNGEATPETEGPIIVVRVPQDEVKQIAFSSCEFC